jgi:RNA polymerase sigma-70 factor, ECF subfamily
MTHLAIASVGSQSGDEELLVGRARSGDRGAAHTLYERHAERVYRLVFRLCNDEDEARDLTQDAFVRAFDRLESFRGDSSFGTWLYRVALSVALNARRRDRRLAQRWERMTDDVADDRPRAEPDLQARLREAIAALPERQRVVFVMHALEGYTHVEIGNLLGISEGTSKGRLFDARGRLKKALADFEGDY